MASQFWRLNIQNQALAEVVPSEGLCPGLVSGPLLPVSSALPSVCVCVQIFPFG